MNIPLTSRNNLLIIGLAVILSLSVLALMFPYRISLFQPLVCLLFVSFLFVRRKIQLTWMIIPFLVIGALYGIPFLFSYNFAGGVATRDFVNMLSVSLLALLFFNIITEEQDWNTFFSTFSKIVVVITTLVSVIGFIKFHYLMRGCQFSFFTGDGEDYQNGTTLVYDYNYYALGGIIGVLFCFSLMKRYRAGTPKVYLAVMGMINLMNVLLSGSRRGFMLMMIIILVYIAEAIFRMITRRISKTALTIFIVSAALSVCSVLLAFSYVVRTDIQQKQRVAVSLRNAPGPCQVNLPVFNGLFSFSPISKYI
ncbi:MAG: hypothetical protein NTU44_19700 [Bacteroidetes bacterium]|nr:hypothetical protein [Bacteroidota bacterium]